MPLRVGLLFAWAAGAFSADLFSLWKGTIETGGRPVPVYLRVIRQDGALTGSIATGTGGKYAPVDNIAVEGESLRFDVRDNAGRMVHFRLALSGDALSGESKVGDEVSRVRLSRAPGSGPADVDRGVYRVGGGVSVVRQCMSRAMPRSPAL